MIKLKLLLESDISYQEKKVRELLGKNYEDFVKSIPDYYKDDKVRALLFAGRKDGNKKDEEIPITTKNIKCIDLFPTQKEIDMSKSLYWTLTNKKNTLDLIFSNGPVILGGSPVVTLNSKYIIDGHHRWSEVYIINPQTEIVCTNMEANWLKPIYALKATQLAIAGRTGGNIPQSTVDGTNLIGIDEKIFNEYVSKTLTEEAIKIFIKYKPELKKPKSIEKYLWENVKLLNDNNKPISHAPSRAEMPQTNADNVKNNPLDFMKQGVLNIAYPITNKEKV